MLYGASALACRHFHDLAYKSQRQTPDGQAYRRANNLRTRLGWGPGVIYGPGGKPKGMHWHTFWRLHMRYDASVLQALDGANVRMDKLMADFEHFQQSRARR